MTVNKIRQKTRRVENKKIIYDKELCVQCGCCVRECRTGGFVTKEKGAEIFIGGRFGRGMKIGDSLGEIFKEEEIIPVINELMVHYKKIGLDGERISKTIDRVGRDEFLNEALK